MKVKETPIAILMGLLLGGIAYWTQPYSQLSFRESDIILLMWTAGAFFGGIALMFFLKLKPWRIAFFLACGFMLSVVGRIIFDSIFVDPTHHNLAPFEIGICGIFVFPFSFAGVYLFLLTQKLKK